MKRRRSIWESLNEASSEGPTVTLTIPRETAEALLDVLKSSVEVDDGGDNDGGEDFDDESGILPDLEDDGIPGDLDALDDGPPTDDLKPAGRGPGRPKGSKGKNDQNDDEPKKDEKKVNESAFSILARSFSRRS